MNFTKLVPNIFYADTQSQLKMFVDCPEPEIGHNEIEVSTPFCVAVSIPAIHYAYFIGINLLRRLKK